MILSTYLFLTMGAIVWIVSPSVGLWEIVFRLPAFVDGFVDEMQVLLGNTANEEDPDVVFHRDKLRVVHPRFLDNSLRRVVELDLHRPTAQLRFALQCPRS